MNSAFWLLSTGLVVLFSNFFGSFGSFCLPMVRRLTVRIFAVILLLELWGHISVCGLNLDIFLQMLCGYMWLAETDFLSLFLFLCWDLYGTL